MAVKRACFLEATFPLLQMIQENAPLQSSLKTASALQPSGGNELSLINGQKVSLLRESKHVLKAKLDTGS